MPHQAGRQAKLSSDVWRLTFACLYKVLSHTATPRFLGMAGSHMESAISPLTTQGAVG